MDPFCHRDGQLFAEGVALTEIAARFGTPVYVYSRHAIEESWRSFEEAFAGVPHLICYAVKANSSLAVLNVLARLGSGFDIVSVGELERVLRAGGDPAKVVFAGVGKRAEEMRRALEVGIRCFNVESEPELLRLDGVAREFGVQAPVSLRVNPDVDAKTHRYVATGMKDNKFGIAMEQALDVYGLASRLSHIRIIGVGCHIGSQLTATQPFEDALERVLRLLERLQEKGIAIGQVDIGGGLGIRYRDEAPPAVATYAAAIRSRLAGLSYDLVLEPGRAIVGNAGVLLTRVEFLKTTPHKNFAVVDAAMNDLIRPALYDAWQRIEPVQASADRPGRVYDVVGPVCETADFLGRDRELAVQAGDLLAVRSAGAYGFAMSSTYNARPRAAEVMVDGTAVHLIRRREGIDELMSGEVLLPV